MDKKYLIVPGVDLPPQKNALRVEIIPPESRCALCPKTDFSSIVRARFNWRTDQLSRLWNDFDYCVGGNRPCESCPVFHKHQERSKPPIGSVIRLDPIHTDIYWLLPNRDRGWNAFGYWYKGLATILVRWAIDVDPVQKRDEFGVYWDTVYDGNQL